MRNIQIALREKENLVTHQAGIWIDHRKAIIVELTPDGETIKTVQSQVEMHPERGGDSPMKGGYEARQVPADDSRQRALTGDLNHYYDAVIAALPHDVSLLLIGPGEAKGEFYKRIVKTKPAARISAVQTDDKMSDKEVIANVRAHFGVAAPRR
jgi:hypothetical protein